MREIERKVQTFCLTNGGSGNFDELVAKPDVTIASVQDCLTKDGEVIRVVDFNQRVKPPVYPGPIC